MMREKFSEWRQKRCRNRQESTDKSKVMHRWEIAFFALCPFIIYILVEWLQGTFPNPISFNFVLNLLFYYGISLLIYGLSKNLFLYAFIPGILLWILGTINHYMIVMRNKPLVPWEIFALGTAKNVAGGVSIVIDFTVVCTFLILVGLCVFGWIIRKAEFHKRLRLIALITSIVFILSFTLFFFFPPSSIFSYEWKPIWQSQVNGLAVNLVHSFRNLINTPPEGYSVERVREIVGDNGRETELQPDIIVIMNESFSDFSSFADIKTTEDLIPFVHSMNDRENTVTGTVRVSVFGGGTCNSEYDFLTSNATPLLRSGSYPMVQFVTEKNPSIARSLKDRGYRTIGIHPYYADGWSRNTSYPRLGFDKFISYAYFKNPKMIRSYISDESSYKKIVSALEADPSKPAFIFNVTMQNHMAYDKHYDNLVEKADFPEKDTFPQAKQYFSLLQESDKAIHDLIKYLEGRERPTIVLFFGDHLPAVEEEYYDLLQTRSGYDDNEMENIKHTTPFFIWANYDIEEKRDVDISISFLAPLLLESAGASMTDYQNYLYELSQRMPLWEEGRGEDLQGYKMAQYNMVFDDEGYQGDLFE